MIPMQMSRLVRPLCYLSSDTCGHVSIYHRHDRQVIRRVSPVSKRRNRGVAQHAQVL